MIFVVVCLVGSNPKNSLTSLTLKSYPSCSNLEDRGQRSRSEPPEDNKLGSQSKSNPNLSQQLCVRTNLSKSAISLGVRDFDTIFDPEDSDYETKARYFSRDGLDEIVIEPEDLLHMVFQVESLHLEIYKDFLSFFFKSPAIYTP